MTNERIEQDELQAELEYLHRRLSSLDERMEKTATHIEELIDRGE